MGMNVTTTTFVPAASSQAGGPRTYFGGRGDDDGDGYQSDRPRKRRHIIGTILEVGTYMTAAATVVAAIKFHTQGLSPFSLYKSIAKKAKAYKPQNIPALHNSKIADFKEAPNAAIQWLSEMNTRITGWFYKGVKLFTNKRQQQFIEQQANDMFELATLKKNVRKYGTENPTALDEVAATRRKRSASVSTSTDATPASTNAAGLGQSD